MWQCEVNQHSVPEDNSTAQFLQPQADVSRVHTKEKPHSLQLHGVTMTQQIAATGGIILHLLVYQIRPIFSGE